MHEILIVDDTPENIRLLKSILKAEGYQTRVATNGKMAIESVKITPPTIILMDINMPIMDGIEACIAIKSLPERKTIPIIFISAYSDIQQISQAFEVGGCDYITKPFNQLEVLIRIKNQISLLEANHRQLHMEMLNSTIQIIMGVAHEINTPLGTSITANSYIEEQLKDLNEQFSDQTLTQKKLLTHINKTTEAAELITKNLFKVSNLIDTFRMLLQNQEQETHPFDLKKQIASIANSTKNSLAEVGASYRINGDSVNITSVLASFNQLFQCLFDNSIQHAYPNNGQYCIEIDIKKTNKAVLIQYQDNGIGMSQDALNKLFNPFYMAARTGEHVGLSATLIFNIVTLSLKGTINASSTVEHGLCYQITLPLQLPCELAVINEPV